MSQPLVKTHMHAYDAKCRFVGGVGFHFGDPWTPASLCSALKGVRNKGRICTENTSPGSMFEAQEPLESLDDGKIMSLERRSVMVVGLVRRLGQK